MTATEAQQIAQVMASAVMKALIAADKQDTALKQQRPFV
jgi:hypothetical protein